MEKEHVDPVYEYIDNKVKLLKREIKQLKIAHNAVAQRHEDALIKLEQYVLTFRILSMTNEFSAIIDKSNLGNKQGLITQLLLDAKDAKTNVRKNQDPLPAFSKFRQTWAERLHGLGTDFLEF